MDVSLHFLFFSFASLESSFLFSVIHFILKSIYFHYRKSGIYLNVQIALALRYNHSELLALYTYHIFAMYMCLWVYDFSFGKCVKKYKQFGF